MKKRITALALAIFMVLGTVALAAGTEKTVTVSPMTLNINGQAVTPTKSDGTAAEVFSYEGATYVPLRYLSELLGITVEWDKNAPNTAKLVMDKMTYTASKLGMNGQVEVQVTLAGDKIENVTVTKNQETPGIGAPLFDGKAEGSIPVVEIPQAIVAAQSLAVDSVTGATITSYAIKSAVEDCLKQAGLDVAKYKTPVEKKAPEAVTKDADVVVVGGGGAGLAAAISAAQNGAKVIVVEKNGAVGGDTLVCGGIYNNPDPALQSKVEMTESVKGTIEAALSAKPVSAEHKALMDEVQKEWNEYKKSGRTDLFDSEAWYTLQTYNGGDQVADLELVKVLTYNAIGGFEWVQELGMEFQDTIGQGAGSLWQRTHSSVMSMGTGFIYTYVENIAKDKNIEILTSTTGTELIKDAKGAVVGVKATGKDGDTYTLNAKKGVVLATGGFSANGEMVQEYNTTGKWPDLSKVMTTNRRGCSQGEGITMAAAVGADLVDMDQIQLLQLGNVKDGGMTKYPTRVLSGTDQILCVNKEGKRFVREDGRRDEICTALLEQTDSTWFFIESADGNYTDVKTAVTADGFTFQQMEEEGYIYIADTIEELAAKIGCDPATLKATVDTFNTSVETGKDELGRTLFSTKLVTGPFVATPRQPCVHHTMGGVKIDTQCRVIGTDGKAIKGLVAAGEITGGIHGGNRLGGNAVVDTVVFGKLAGETISK